MTGLNIFIAYHIHAGDWATSFYNIIHALSPGYYITVSWQNTAPAPGAWVTAPTQGLGVVVDVVFTCPDPLR